MLVMTGRTRLLGSAALAALALGFPTAALGAGSANPKVMRIDPSSGAQTVLAAGAPLGRLRGIALEPSGTIYVASYGPPPEYTQGAGIFSLSGPSFAVTPFAATGEAFVPNGVVVSASTLYPLDSGVLSIETSAPFTRRAAVTDCGGGQACAPDPDFAALSGTTLYGTTWEPCEDESAGDDGGSWLVAVDTATGKRTQIADYGCSQPEGIAVARTKTLTVRLVR